MGLYDTVLVPCPNCGRHYEAQSKSGTCFLETYSIKDAPDDVYEDVNRHAPFLCECGHSFEAPPREGEIERLRAEVERMRPVYEAAKAWRTSYHLSIERVRTLHELEAAIDAALAQEGL